VPDVASDRLTTQLGEVVVAPASPRDAGAVLQLRDSLASWLVARGIDQWRPGDMPLAWIEECAAQGWIFTARREGDLVGSVTLVWTDPLIWADRNEPAGYIHMLMVDREHAHLGLGRSLLDWAEQQIVVSGHRRARLDCVSGNPGLCAYYERAGYQLVGEREFEGSIPTVGLYEKALSGDVVS
jgi:protein-tyrosine phosphatase